MGYAWIAINAVSLENGLERGKSNLWSFKLEIGIHYSELLAQFLFVGWNLWWYHLHSLVEVMMQDEIHYWSLWSCIFSLQIGVHCMWILMKAKKGRVTFPDRKKIYLGNKQPMTGERKFNRKELGEWRQVTLKTVSWNGKLTTGINEKFEKFMNQGHCRWISTHLKQFTRWGGKKRKWIRRNRRKLVEWRFQVKLIQTVSAIFCDTLFHQGFHIWINSLSFAIFICLPLCIWRYWKQFTRNFF